LTAAALTAAALTAAALLLLATLRGCSWGFTRSSVSYFCHNIIWVTG